MDSSLWANQARWGATQIIVAKPEYSDEMAKESFADRADSNGCAEFAEHARPPLPVVPPSRDQRPTIERNPDIDHAAVITDPLFDRDADRSDRPTTHSDAGRPSIGDSVDLELSQDRDDGLVKRIAVRR